MVNLVVILAFGVEIHGVMHIYIMAWIARPFLFHGPIVVIFQCTVFLPSLWLIFTYLPVLILGVGNALLPNILPQNHLQPR